MTAYCINEIQLPPTEAIHYSLKATSPPLWCYVEQALDQLPAMLRLMVLMAQTFHWSETRIAAYLQAEGEAITPSEVVNLLQEGYRVLEEKLPTDIRTIYLSENFLQPGAA
jgi:DNA-directed RNA polymerase specialized sigma24 family protein